jgi:hypothetical protein
MNDSAAPAPSADARPAGSSIGRLIEIAGSSSQISFDAQLLGRLRDDPDPSIAMAGQVGSQVKVRVEQRWLLANVRTLRLAEADSDLILAAIDFIGEGEEDPYTGRIVGFRRGVTRYPMPGAHI